MQLKREIDYTLRLLFDIVKQNKNEEGICLSQLCRDTSLPRVIVFRLCQKMADKHMIEIMEQPEAEIRYRQNQVSLDTTLFEVVEGMEGTAKLLAVFEKSSMLYKQCGNILEQTEEQVADALKSVTLRTLIEKN